MWISKAVLSLLFTILQSQSEAALLDLVPAEQTVPDIYIRLEEVLKSCFLSRPSTLVITSDLEEVVRNIFDDCIVANVFVLDENFDALQSHRNFPRWPMFLLTANSTKTLTRMLQRLKSSAFWHADSTFFIAGAPRRGCDRASKMLNETWDVNLLASFYICEDLEGKVLLYTYNPFTPRAPAPWKAVETMSDGRWTLYSHSFSEGKSIYTFLEFDKTQFLDGYKINAATILQPGATLRENETVHARNLATKTLYDDAMSQTVIWTKMNVTPIIHVDPTLSHRDDSGKSVITRMFDDKTFDYIVLGVSIFRIINDNFSFMYPFGTYSISILTMHRNFLTPAEKIANFYSFGAVSLTCLAFVITWIVFVIQKRGKMAAALDILRMTLSTSVLRPLGKISIRIYLFGILWLVLILNATFQGNMSLFLTKPTRIDVETMNDLETHRYHVFVPEIHRPVVSKYLQSIPVSHLHFVKNIMCYDVVVNNTKAACLQPLPGMINAATTYDLHVSHKHLTSVPRAHVYRPDWPLAKKINRYMSRLMAAGLLGQWNAKTEKYPVEKLESREEQATAPVVRKIRLVDLNFAFVILGIGLTIATLFFVVEVGGNPMAKRSPKFAKRLQHPRCLKIVHIQ